MKKKTFEKEERKEIVDRLQRFFVRELDSEIGQIAAEQLIGFIGETIGPFYYNQGLRDAQALLARQVDTFNDEIYGLEEREARVR
jgi:uncharacterized protein (DUF2164 family)